VAKDTSQVGLRLPSDVLRKLQQDPDGVSEAIRRRIEWTFKLDKYDEASRALSSAVMNLSRDVRLHTGIEWTENEGVRRTLLAAIDAYTLHMSARFTEEEGVPHDPDSGEPDTSWRDDPANWGGFDDDPQKLGHRLAKARIQLISETSEEDDGTQAR
jgi:hypothetical protein